MDLNELIEDTANSIMKKIDPLQVKTCYEYAKIIMLSDAPHADFTEKELYYLSCFLHGVIYGVLFYEKKEVTKEDLILHKLLFIIVMSDCYGGDPEELDLLYQRIVREASRESKEYSKTVYDLEHLGIKMHCLFYEGNDNEADEILDNVFDFVFKENYR